jgi:hypothetical protein
MADLRSTRQFIRGGEAAIMILVMGKQIIRPQAVEMATACAQFRKDDFA